MIFSECEIERTHNFNRRKEKPQQSLNYWGFIEIKVVGHQGIEP